VVEEIEEVEHAKVVKEDDDKEEDDEEEVKDELTTIFSMI